MTTRVRKAGEFCWFNMLTPEPERAREFFGALLGWTFQDTGIGHSVLVAGRAVGGLFDLASPTTPRGTPPLIGLMVKVASVDATARNVGALGGQARPPFDIGGAGRMAVCHDPEGTEFDVWESRALQGMDVDAHATGAPTWFETLATDVERAAKFYSTLFGWKPDSPAADQRTFRLGRRPVAGARRSAPATHWAAFFAVRDAAAAARAAHRLGGEVVAPLQIVNGSRRCGIRSPQGVPFHVMQREA